MPDDENMAPAPVEIDYVAIVVRYGQVTKLGTALTFAYDLVARSLDYGSGFLDDEEIRAMRKIGQAIGAPEEIHYPSCTLNKYDRETKTYGQCLCAWKDPL